MAEGQVLEADDGSEESNRGWMTGIGLAVATMRGRGMSASQGVTVSAFTPVGRKLLRGNTHARARYRTQSRQYYLVVVCQSRQCDITHGHA